MAQSPQLVPIDLSALFNAPLRRLLTPVEPAIQKLLQVDRLAAILHSARESAGICERLLAMLDVTFHVSDADLARIPATGPLVVTANHPFGFLEAFLLPAVLGRVRRDCKILANSLLASVPELQSGFIFVNPYGGRDSILENRKPVRESLEWLRQGGALIVFPAGDVARLNWKDRGIVDPPWNAAVGRLIRAAACPALPVHLAGANGLGFQIMGALHPRLRTVNLPRETLNKRGRRIDVRIGRPVPAKDLKAYASGGEAIGYLRFRSDLLAHRRTAPGPNFIPLPFAFPRKRLAPVACETRRELLIDETARLQPMCQTDDFAVYLAAAHAIPSVLREIGRLRELTFRDAGEGTGNPLDLDSFDPHYLHLFLWSKTEREIAGAYRLAPAGDLLPRFGVRGLYSNTLFQFSPRLFEHIGPALEMGRSFVRPEYQKHYAPLLMLWKGITRYVAAHPECAVLFGAVSISNDYNPVSRSLLAGYLETCKDELAGLVKPRRPYRPHRDDRWHAQDLEELSAPIADLEPDGKGVPILIKQYMRAGGRVLGFNIDPRFSNVLDVLMMVDLRRAPVAVLERYMGRESTAAFLRRH